MDNKYDSNQPQGQPEPIPAPSGPPQPVDTPYPQEPVVAQPPADPTTQNAQPDAYNNSGSEPVPTPPTVPPPSYTQPPANITSPASNIDRDESRFSSYEFPTQYQPPVVPLDTESLPLTQPQTSVPEQTPPANAQPTPAVTPETLPQPSYPVAEPPVDQPPAAAVENIAVESINQPVPPAAVSYTPEPTPVHPTPPANTEPAAPATAVTSPLLQFKSRLKQKSQKFQKGGLKPKLKPLAGAAIVGAVIYGVFNSQLILGQLQYLISPGANAEGPAIVDTSQAAGNKSEIIIPKINLRAPVVYDVKTFTEAAVQEGLKRGVVHYGTTAVPGQKGNNVIVGHSSNNWWASGKYKFAFVLLNKLEEGDTFYLHYNSRRYTYEVKSKKIVTPDNVDVLNQNVSTPITTLITCDPPGTSWKRLIVQAEQIDPDPTTASKAGVNQQDTKTPLPGDGESLFQKIKDIFS